MAEARTSTATFAAGCFWGVQDAFDELDGVLETTSGYMGGDVPNPTYEQVCAGGTGHLEAVQLTYNTRKISYARLLEVFWEKVNDITLLALDYHTGQYLPVIFCHDEGQLRLAGASHSRTISSGKRSYSSKVVEIKESGTFWPEPDENHQHYCRKQGESH